MSARTDRASSRPGGSTSVAPSARASSHRDSAGSTATIGSAPASRAPCSALSPTPPSPKTTTDSPGRTRAELSTAPTPVSTAQPSSAAWAIGRSAGTGMQALAPTTVSVAKAPVPRPG